MMIWSIVHLCTDLIKQFCSLPYNHVCGSVKPFKLTDASSLPLVLLLLLLLVCLSPSSFNKLRLHSVGGDTDGGGRKVFEPQTEEWCSIPLRTLITYLPPPCMKLIQIKNFLKQLKYVLTWLKSNKTSVKSVRFGRKGSLQYYTIVRLLNVKCQSQYK